MIKTILLLAASAVPAIAGLTVEKPWVMALPPSAKDTAAFMVFVNDGPEPVRITGGRTAAAKRLAPMISTHESGRTGMQDVPFIEVPPRARVELRPGGDHLMLYGLKAPLKTGGRITLELAIEPGRRVITVDAEVRKAK